MDLTAGYVVQDVRVHGIKPAVRRESTIGDIGVGHLPRRGINDFPVVTGAAHAMQVARSIGVPMHIAGVDVILAVVGRDPLHGRAKDRIDVAGARRH